MHKLIASMSLLALLAVSPAQAAPTEITACGTISQSGSYELAQNISALSGDCMVITTSFVTIDLQGFTIAGNSSGTGILSQAQGITIRRGTIAGFHNGVSLGLETLSGSVVEGVHIFVPFINPGTAIRASGIVKDNVVIGGGTDSVGISAVGTVTGNYIGPGGDVGISVLPGSTVIGNTVISGGRVGLQISCPSNVTNNTSINSADNLIIGQGCNDTNNVAP